MSDDRATLVGLSMDDPSASVRDPAFQTLLRDGWKVAAHLPAERAGRQEWIFLMVPPGPTEVERVWWKTPVLPLWIMVVLNLIMIVAFGVQT